MTLDQLLIDLTYNQVVLLLMGDRLRYRAPESALNADMRMAIGEHRDVLIEQLRKTASDHRQPSKCVTCHRQNRVDEPLKDGRIRTQCGKCGQFIGYRPAGQ